MSGYDENCCNPILRLKFGVYRIYHYEKTIWMMICFKAFKLSIPIDNSMAL